MVLCELTTASTGGSWSDFLLSTLAAWGILAGMGVISMFVFSGTLFKIYYMNPTYEQWRWKSNPKFPTPEKVRDEILQMLKGCVTGTLCPALALTISRGSAWNQSKAFCNAELGWQYNLTSFLMLWVVCDFYEWFYHYLGHRFVIMWEFHRAHHVFFNPSPFAVIADEYVDMMMRSLPLLVIPVVVPIDMDLLFGTFAVFFYGYGTFIHWGYEASWLDAHNPIVNTPFQHYCHHAVSGRTTVYHTGFFFKIWDQLAGSVYPKACFCVRCQQKEGKRERHQWEKLEKPDYSKLLDISFYLSADAMKFDDTQNDVIHSKAIDKTSIDARVAG